MRCRTTPTGRRPRALRCAGLGGHGFHRFHLLPAAALFGKTEMYSVKLITTHFWIATIGIVLYIASMWIAGVMQGLMWRAVNADGTLAYSFVESVKGSYPFWAIRWLGGVLFLSGMLIMAYNMFKTMAGGKTQDAPVLFRRLITPD
jgi:cytochrome c oxidase cbb3-type subunit 1